MFRCMTHRTDVKDGFARRQQCCVFVVEMFGLCRMAMTRLDPGS
jgi:hypothetical protein